MCNNCGCNADPFAFNAEKKNCGCGQDPCVTYGAEPELVSGPCEICGEDLFRDYDDSMGDVCLSCYYEERSKQDDEGSEYDGWLLNFAESFGAEGGDLYIKTFREGWESLGMAKSRTWISGYFSSYDAAMKDAKEEKDDYEVENPASMNSGEIRRTSTVPFRQEGSMRKMSRKRSAMDEHDRIKRALEDSGFLLE